MMPNNENDKDTSSLPTDVSRDASKLNHPKPASRPTTPKSAIKGSGQLRKEPLFPSRTDMPTPPKVADEPEKLSVEMKDFLSTTEGRLPSNRSDIYFKELGNESPVLVKLMMQTIYQNDKRTIKHIGAQQFGMKFLLRGLYAHNGLLYFHTRMENGTNMPYSVDFITFKVVDKKMAKRTAIQEQILQPLRAYHQVMQVRGMGSEHTVFALEQFSLAEDKQLEVTLYERNGGRTLTFHITAEDLQLAKKIDNLKLKW